MTLKVISSVVFLFGAVALTGTSIEAIAQSEVPPVYYGGISTGADATCPTTAWHIRPMPPIGAATIVGVAYFSDMSGISKIEGSRAADGSITGAVTSISGNGPSGHFSGMHTSTKTHVELQGTGCSKHLVNMQRLPLNYGTLADPG
jgi:hypothetical protein